MNFTEEEKETIKEVKDYLKEAEKNQFLKSFLWSFEIRGHPKFLNSN